MILNTIFKAYDIRGKYPSEINETICAQIVSEFLSRQLKVKSKSRRQSVGTPTGTSEKLKVVIGHDARLSSPALYRSAIKSIKYQVLSINDKKNKFIILPVGLITTPMLYFLVNDLKADYGIMITASHNPKEYNGLKIVGKNAEPISGKEVLEIINFQ